MKPLFALLILAVTSVSLLKAQEEIEMEIFGVVRDTVQDKVVPGVKITLQVSDTTFQFLGEDDGSFEMNITLPKGQVVFFMTASGPEITSRDILVDTVATTDLRLDIDFHVQPRSVCSDSFLPGYIHFDKNANEPNSKDLKMLEQWAEMATSTEHQIFKDRVFTIKSYCSFSEDQKIAELRARQIESILLENGIAEEQIDIQIVGHQDFNYYPYRDGCHYYFLTGTEIDLSHEAIQSADSLQQEKRESLRRLVDVR